MLGNFNRTVLLVASVLLILGLIIIGFFIVKSVQDSAYPPVISDCPDYWNVNYDPVTQKKICTNNSINPGPTTNECRNYPVSLFSANGSSEADIICAKNKWAKSCNIHWDGITNNSKACIQTTI
jgi:hypothetical protein